MISVCMITKNEREKLSRSLASLSGYDLEVVVVDTGSTDGTMELLQSWQSREDKAFTLSIGQFDWCGDFAKARNYCASLAANDKILVIDSDEMILEMNLPDLERMMEKYPKSVGWVSRKDKTEQGGLGSYRLCWQARVYNRKYCFYERKIHEQIRSVEGEKEASYYKTKVLLDHDGYLGTEEERRAKARRNIALLKEELADKGDDPYIWYHLGKNYTQVGENERALDAYLKALSADLDPGLEYVADMVEAYGYLLINTNQAQAALGLENISDAFGHRAEFRLLMGHVYMNNCMFEKAVGEFLRAAECKDVRIDGANSFLAYYNAGVVCECLGQKEKAADLYKKCGDYPLAEKRREAMKKSESFSK